MKSLEYESQPLPSPTVPAALYAIEAMLSVGGTLLSIGIVFVMNHRFGWQMRQNFLLATGQGIVYVPGALSARWLAERFGRRAALSWIYLVLAALALVAAAAKSPVVIAVLLLGFTFVIGTSWPMLESLVTTGVDASALGRRVGTYNMIWPAAGFVAIAVEGLIIRYWTAGVFVIPAAVCVASAALLAFRRPETPVPPPIVEPSPAAEPELIRSRTLALWLSRTALPATYTVVYGLMPMMPSLPVMKRLSTENQTLVSSVWLGTRWIAFAALALGTWWHTRPRALLWAAVLMLVSFFGMTLAPSTLFPAARISYAADLTSLILWQGALGLSLGMIYSGSLYFGMVLSDGSTEHGGYHEALIGLGWLIGPAAGAAAEILLPNNMMAGVTAVGAVIAASVLLVLITAVVVSRLTCSSRSYSSGS